MSADLIVTNGRLYSVDLNGTETRAEAIAVKDGIIEAIGNCSEIEALCGKNTKIIDAAGASILPGLGDSHVHATFSASAMFSANLFGCPKTDAQYNIEFCKEKMAEYIKEHPDDEIIRGCGWNSAILSEKTPTRHDLDEICSDRPVILESFCQHFVWVNTKAIEMAGVTSNTPTPRTGVVFREEDGYPSGVFGEFAGIMMIRDGLKSDFSVEQYKDTLRIYQRDLANKYGVTMIFDAYCTENGREAYKQMARDGELTIRVKGNYYADPSKDPEQFDEIISRRESGEDVVSDLYGSDTVKFFLEGSGAGFYSLEPFEKEYCQMTGVSEEFCGAPFWTDEEIKEYFNKLNSAGIQLHCHAMGSASVRQAVDGYENSRKRGAGDVRNVIAHLMQVDEDDIRRMGENKVIACVQPTWMMQEPLTGPGMIFMFGKERYLNSYPYKRLIDAGCVTALGTDFPVTPPPDPFISIEHGMRRTISEACYLKVDDMYYSMILGPEDNPEQDIVSLKDAIQGLTAGVAYQNFLENITGTLEVGKSAEIVVLDKDIESLPADAIHTVNVKKTIFKGNVVYEI